MIIIEITHINIEPIYDLCIFPKIFQDINKQIKISIHTSTFEI